MQKTLNMCNVDKNIARCKSVVTPYKTFIKGINVVYSTSFYLFKFNKYLFIKYIV